MSGAVDCRRRSLGALGGLPGRDAGSLGAVRPSWRKWSVIMCPGEGRGPPRHLQLPQPYEVCGCTCGTAGPHRAPRHREQDLRFRDQHRRAALLRTFSHNDASGAAMPPTPPLSVAHSWTTSVLPQRVPPLKRHLTHTGAFGLPPSAELSRLPPRVPSRASPSSDEQHDSWMPTTRRLLLEPAPHRVTTQGMPYGGPALRTPPPTPPPTPRPSAFRPPSASSSYYCSGEIVYELRPGPVPGVSFSVPVFGSMVVRAPQEAGYAPYLPDGVPPSASTALPDTLAVSAVGLPDAPSPGPKQCLRVLRPDELEQRKAALAAAPPPSPSPAAPAAIAAEDESAKKGEAEDYAAALGKAGSPTKTAVEAALEVDIKSSKRQWLLRVVRENFNEQIGTLVERFVRRPRHDKSVRRVPGIGRKVNINLQDFWRRSSGQERHMKTKDLLTVYTDSGMDWRAFQRWLTKDLQFMPSCAKLTALSLDIYQRYWSADWVDDADFGSPS